MNSSPSIKQHFLIGIFLCLWIILFTNFLRPFEHGTMTTRTWIFASLSFGLSALISYMCFVFFQRKIIDHYRVFDLKYILIGLLLYFIIYSLISYALYRSPLLSGFYSFPEFLGKIIIKIAIVLTPVLLLIQQYSHKLFSKNEERDVIIKGENKIDILRLKQSQIISVSNAQNYVEISYLKDEKINKKIIRASLKNILEEHKFLIQVHRSHLINPDQITSWSDSKTLLLKDVEIPVSKNFRINLPEQ